MSLKNWLEYRWLTEHRSSPQEIRDLLSVADRDITEAARQHTNDWKLTIAYNSALQSATAALAAAGYRAVRERKHQITLDSLEHTIKLPSEQIRTLHALQRKRNTAGYERTGAVSDIEAETMLRIARELRDAVWKSIQESHPELFK